VQKCLSNSSTGIPVAASPLVFERSELPFIASRRVERR
jgi:hypothetical protein